MEMQNITTEDWERCVPMVADAIPALGGTHELPDIIRELLAGRLTLWAGQECFILTEINEYPQMRELNVFLAGGNLKEIASFDGKMTEYARYRGCRRITTTARKGFMKKDVWTGKGWKMPSVILQKELHDG